MFCDFQNYSFVSVVLHFYHPQVNTENVVCAKHYVENTEKYS